MKMKDGNTVQFDEIGNARAGGHEDPKKVERLGLLK
jgi:hypothetical protein